MEEEEQEVEEEEEEEQYACPSYYKMRREVSSLGPVTIMSADIIVCRHYSH